MQKASYWVFSFANSIFSSFFLCVCVLLIQTLLKWSTVTQYLRALYSFAARVQPYVSNDVTRYIMGDEGTVSISIYRKYTRYHTCTICSWKPPKDIKYSILLPGHECVLHPWLSCAAPGHVFPPNFGAGCVQLLERSLKPVPQDLLQDVHLVQSDQPPSTKENKNKIRTENEEKIWNMTHQ